MSENGKNGNGNNGNGKFGNGKCLGADCRRPIVGNHGICKDQMLSICGV